LDRPSDPPRGAVELSEHVTSDEPYLLVEEVAERLGLPLSVLLHRVEAGDIPAQRIETEDGVHYALRLGDLGIELDDEGLRSAAIGDDGEEETTLSAVFEQDDASRSVQSAIVSAFDSGPEPLPGERVTGYDVTGRRVDDEGDAEDDGEDDDVEAFGSPAAAASTAAAWSDPDAAEPWRDAELPPPVWAVRPREPQEPPVWLAGDPGALDEDDEPEDVEDVEDVYVELDSDAEFIDDDGIPAMPHSSLDAEPAADDMGADDDTIVAELAVPPPSRHAQMGIIDSGSPGPRGDLASMSLDARELVAGLLDRWERTLEQRIYTEQRQRFQAELVARQNMVKQLQMELHAARAEHAAAQAEKDRVLAGKERELADRERDLAETRRVAEEAERTVAAASRRRRWFWSRDD
jgi:hypothetical protein